MKNLSLDSFNKINKKFILLAEDYTEYSKLSDIIKMCRLKPVDISKSLELKRIWIDEYGNLLEIIDKKINIKYNNVVIDRSKILSTDLYYGLSLENIAKISKVAYISCGYDEDLYATISFWGIDNYLRTYLYCQNEWTQVSSLILGINNIRNFIIKGKTRFFIKYAPKKEKMPFPCQKGEQWITCLPVSGRLLSMLNVQYDGIFSFLKQKE